MARALLGHIGTSTNEYVLASEVARLRRRVAELEAELVSVREHAGVTGIESLEVELHRLAETQAPALA